ncbi:MAG: hypothetical protein QI223_03285 [Candidatus Korarchaeota archaeon]|nr:hypothetical protein [Candidatus Korarchaeota archaeon]
MGDVRVRDPPTKSRLVEILRGLLSGDDAAPPHVSTEAWSILAALDRDGLELLSDQALRAAWERLIRSGLVVGDVDLYQLADRWEILRRMARRVLSLMKVDDLRAAARAVMGADLETTTLGREVLRRLHALEGE